MKNRKTIIKVEHLTAAYQDNVVLDDISFEVHQGKVFVILGGSGCGKSTLLKHLIGLYHPAKGKILIDGEDITTAEGGQRHKILSKFGVAYQSGALFGSMTIKQNIRLVLEEFTSLPDDAMDWIALSRLKLVGLEDDADKLPSELSGGMKKRAAIARAMALEPEIIFLDEPSAGLDPVTSASLDELIIDLSQSLGTTFVVVSHELSSIFSIADEVIMLCGDTKKIIARGKPEDLKNNSDIPFVRLFFNRQSKNEN